MTRDTDVNMPLMFINKKQSNFKVLKVSKNYFMLIFSIETDWQNRSN